MRKISKSLATVSLVLPLALAGCGNSSANQNSLNQQPINQQSNYQNNDFGEAEIERIYFYDRKILDDFVSGEHPFENAEIVDIDEDGDLDIMVLYIVRRPERTYSVPRIYENRVPQKN